MPASVESFVAKTAALVQPASIRYLDGSKEEAASLLAMMETEGMAKRLPKYENCWLTRTDPADVARVESKTVICTATKKETIPEPRAGVQGALGNWMSLRQFRDEFQVTVQVQPLNPGCKLGSLAQATQGGTTRSPLRSHWRTTATPIEGEKQIRADRDSTKRTRAS